MYSDFPPQSLRFSFYGELIILQNVGGRTRVHSDFSSGGEQQDENKHGSGDYKFYMVYKEQ